MAPPPLAQELLMLPGHADDPVKAVKVAGFDRARPQLVDEVPPLPGCNLSLRRRRLAFVPARGAGRVDQHPIANPPQRCLRPQDALSHRGAAGVSVHTNKMFSPEALSSTSPNPDPCDYYAPHMQQQAGPEVLWSNAEQSVENNAPIVMRRAIILANTVRSRRRRSEALASTVGVHGDHRSGVITVGVHDHAVVEDIAVVDGAARVDASSPSSLRS